MGIHFRGEPEGPKLFFDSMCTITSKNHKLNKFNLAFRIIAGFLISLLQQIYCLRILSNYKPNVVQIVITPKSDYCLLLSVTAVAETDVAL